LWVARGGQTCKSKQKSRLSAWLLELKRPLDLRKMDQAGMNVVRLETAAEAAIILNVQLDRSKSMFQNFFLN